MAGSSIFLGVRGANSSDVNLERIPCNSFRFDTTTDGKTYPKIILQRDLDGVSPTLFRAGNSGADFSWAEIEIVKTATDGTPLPWSSITMEDGTFVSDQVTAAPGGNKIEILVLGFHKLVFNDIHNANGQIPPDGKLWGFDFTFNTTN